MSPELLLNKSNAAGIRWSLALCALVVSSCAAAIPDFSAAGGTATTVPTTTSPTTTRPPPTTTSTTTRPPSTTAATSTTVTTTTIAAASQDAVTVGSWTVAGETRDESGSQFTASVTIPILTADVDAGMLGRVATRVDGHVESQIGATLALWRSIEAQGSRDITGSTLELDFDVAAFEDDFISLRFFSREQAAGVASAKRQVTTLMLDLSLGVAIGLDDIIFGGDSRDALLPLVEAGLLERYFDGEAEAFSLWAGDLAVGDLDRAVLTPDGLEIWFDELEVGPPGIGTPVVPIPYAELGEILDPTGPAAVFMS